MIFSEEDIVITYTEEEAVEDGILFDLTKISSLNTRVVNYATTRLLEKGYLDNGKINIPNLIDLVAAVTHIVLTADEPDWFHSGMVELPSGDQQKIFIQQNASGKFTVMLPEDY